MPLLNSAPQGARLLPPRAELSAVVCAPRFTRLQGTRMHSGRFQRHSFLTNERYFHRWFKAVQVYCLSEFYCMCFAWMYVYHMCTMPAGPSEGIRGPGTRVSNGGEPPHGCKEPNPCLLQSSSTVSCWAISVAPQTYCIVLGPSGAQNGSHWPKLKN